MSGKRKVNLDTSNAILLAKMLGKRKATESKVSSERAADEIQWDLEHKDYK